MSRREYREAVEDFQRAKQRAGLQRLIARWTGKSLDLLSFEDVRHQLKAYSRSDKGLQTIPVEAIIGSVSRYNDFSRTFLPRIESDQHRWADVKVAQETKGLPPISVYQIGDAYFVLDGNHRVSIARQQGNSTIEAFVTEVKTKVPLAPDDLPEDLILKAEYADFLERTKLDVTRPEVDLSLSIAGKFPLLLEHIEVHRYYMGIEQERDISYEEAVIHWCDEVYRPAVRLIRETGLIHDFPNRTEADMYVWLAEHREEIETSIGWDVPTETAVSALAQQFNTYTPAGIVSRAINIMLPSSVEAPTTLGRWRRERESTAEKQSILRSFLVPLRGSEPDWRALEQAIVAAQRENSHIYGLFVVNDPSQKEGIMAQAMQAEFERYCTEAGVLHRFITENGEFAKIISKRSRWADAMVLQPFASVKEGEDRPRLYRQIIRHASGPILVTQGKISNLDHLLLAYDHRPASDEALYLAAYLGNRWQVPVTILNVETDGEPGQEAVQRAAGYLQDHGVNSTEVVAQGEVAETILKTAGSQECNLIMMGSPSLSPMFELVVGSTVSQMLQQTSIPLLLCR